MQVIAFFPKNPQFFGTLTLTNETKAGFVAMDTGRIIIDDRQIVSSTLLFDMGTWTVSRGTYDLHIYMNDYDYFDTYYYPEAKFSLRSIKPLGNGEYELTGMLEMVQITREIEFPAKLYKTRNHFGIEAAFTVDVLQWGIVQEFSPYYERLGDERIQNELYFNVKWTFEKE